MSEMIGGGLIFRGGATLSKWLPFRFVIVHIGRKQHVPMEESLQEPSAYDG